MAVKGRKAAKGYFKGSRKTPKEHEKDSKGTRKSASQIFCIKRRSFLTNTLQNQLPNYCIWCLSHSFTICLKRLRLKPFQLAAEGHQVAPVPSEISPPFVARYHELPPIFRTEQGEKSMQTSVLQGI